MLEYLKYKYKRAMRFMPVLYSIDENPHSMGNVNVFPNCNPCVVIRFRQKMERFGTVFKNNIELPHTKK